MCKYFCIRMITEFYMIVKIVFFLEYFSVRLQSSMFTVEKHEYFTRCTQECSLRSDCITSIQHVLRWARKLQYRYLKWKFRLFKYFYHQHRPGRMVVGNSYVSHSKSLETARALSRLLLLEEKSENARPSLSFTVRQRLRPRGSRDWWITHVSWCSLHWGNVYA